MSREFPSARRLGADHQLGVDAAPAQQEPEHERAPEAARADDGPSRNEPHRLGSGARVAGLGSDWRMARMRCERLAVRLKPRRRNESWTTGTRTSEASTTLHCAASSELSRVSLRALTSRRPLRCEVGNDRTQVVNSTSRSTSYSASSVSTACPNVVPASTSSQKRVADALEPVVLLVVEVQEHCLVGRLAARAQSFGTLSLLELT